MHFVIVPGGLAINLAQVSMFEDDPDADELVLTFTSPAHDATDPNESWYVLEGRDRAWMRAYLASIAQAGIWPEEPMGGLDDES